MLGSQWARPAVVDDAAGLEPVVVTLTTEVHHCGALLNDNPMSRKERLPPRYRKHLNTRDAGAGKP